jgi:acetyl-CoA acetyltransferase family protein
MMAAQAVQSGNGEVFVTAGIESMTHVPMGGFNPSLNPKLMQKDMPEAYISMGITAENLAAQYKVSRTEQDEFAASSHEKALAAMKTGLFKDEIVAVTATGQDGKTATVDTDEGPRPGTTAAKLSELKPAFKEGGSVTAGNSSPLTDGAAAVIVMSAERAKALGIKPLARIVSMAVAGCDPAIMGIGPVPAVAKALQRAGLKLGDIGIIELNEAFAAQSIAVLKQLEQDHGVKIDRVKQLNPKGGAIALGHPLGCSGGRIMATLLSDLHQYDKKYGLETMCVGGGQGAAMIVERL